MSTRAILHVGMPKCGSSALQVALSQSTGLFAGSRPVARYVALQADGVLVRDEGLLDRALAGTNGYVVSARAAQLAAFGERRLRRLRARLAETAADGVVLVLSNEGWGNEHAEFRATRLLERLGLEVDVVAYLRPQVGWCNSAWWQWGAWNPRPFPRWLDKQLGRVQWAEVVDGWRAVPGVGKVHARLLPEDILADFCGLLGADPLPAAVVNASLPEPVLRTFQRHRELRGGPHESAIEFSIARHLQVARSVTPWVLERSAIETILARCEATNRALLERLEPADRERMRDDPRWWSAEAWGGLPLAAREPPPADALEADALAASAFAALGQLDTEHRELLLRFRMLKRRRAGLRVIVRAWLQRLRRGPRRG